MRAFIITLTTLILLTSPSGAAGLKGDWHCIHEKDDYKTTRGIKIVGGTLIETGGFGRRVVIKNAAMSEEYVFWNNGTAQEFEIFPAENKLVEKTRIARIVTVLEYKCTAQ